MNRAPSLSPVFTLSLLALAACGESTPTQPEAVAPPDLAGLPPTVASLTSGLGSWTTRAPMPTARHSLTGAVLYNASHQPILYAIGGQDPQETVLRQVEAYNFATNTWTRKAALPHPRTRTNGAVAIGGKIYLSGGWSSTFGETTSLYVYDPASNTWATRASMPVARSDGVSGAINGKLYVLAICPRCLGPERLYRYDPSSNTWTRLADSPRPHYGAAGDVINGKLYVVGGDDNTGRPDSPRGWMDVYDPVTNTWTAKPEGPRQGRAAAAVLGGKLYLLGGFFLDALVDVNAYDPATGFWSGKAPMSAPGVAVARTVTYNGKSYILALKGGATLEQYTP